ncbi:branched-chain amino acid ABC transporter ATP-binding protein/permease [Pseudonocardia sp.]|uniref:branched-chain amino acid ABC transporter ATP-binding protein/permease n=1 Tax=Pseudonocardia sp. TaxID=60912 RepID=UPI0026377FEE|nr:branched-chain amino acid ABC transporter ATP-binding protein/permease [Pseudonocardia sp.]
MTATPTPVPHLLRRGLPGGEWRRPTVTALGVAVVGALAIGLLADDYRLPVLMTVLVYGVVLVGMDVQIGYANQLAMSQPVFMAIGAYSTAAVSTHLDWPPLAGLATGLVITLVLGYVVARAVLRVAGMALTLVSLFLLLISGHLLLVTEFLGASNGLGGIPPLSRALGDPVTFCFLVLGVLVVTVLVAARVMGSATGLEVHVLAEDEAVARSLGINVRRRKVQVFVFGALLADVAGFLFAHGQGFIAPEQFDVAFALSLMLMFFLGGRRSIVGGLIGAAVLLFLPTIDPAVANNLLIIQGVLLTLVLMFARDGIVGLVRLAAGAVARRGRPDVEPADTGAATAEPDLAALPHGRRGGGVAPILVTDGVRKQFGGLAAVDGVSLSVPDRGILPIVGPNGAGKTTYFGVVSGLLPADGGTVHLAGADVTRLADWRRARLGLSRTFQLVRLPGSLSVLDNVASGVRIANTAGLWRSLTRPELTEARAQARQVLEGLGIADLAHQDPGGLTLAGQRFVELARALAGRPSLLLLDEPASGLSDAQREQMAQRLRRIAEHLPILLIEHDLDFIGRLTDHVVVLATGRSIYEGELSGLAADPVVAEAYLGAAPSVPHDAPPAAEPQPAT